MIDLIENNQEVLTWIDDSVASFSGNTVFGKFTPAIIWTSDSNESGISKIPIAASKLINSINTVGLPLFHNHYLHYLMIAMFPMPPTLEK